MKPFDLRLWAARLLIAIVAGWNLECAAVFLLSTLVQIDLFLSISNQNEHNLRI